MRPTAPIEVIVTDQTLFEFGGVPEPSTAGSAAVDLRSLGVFAKKSDGKPDLSRRKPIETAYELRPGETAYISTGIKMHIADPGLAALVIPRSSSSALGMMLGNTTGLIDSDYMGEIIVPLLNRKTSGNLLDNIAELVRIERGERIAQMIIVPIVRPIWKVVDAFSATSERGEGGFGSTGR